MTPYGTTVAHMAPDQLVAALAHVCLLLRHRASG